MGRIRKAIKSRVTKSGLDAVFKHPLYGKSVRIKLGPPGVAATANLRALNDIFLNPSLWTLPPAGNDYIRSEWLKYSLPATESGKSGDPVAVEAKELADLRSELFDTRNSLASALDQLDQANQTIRTQKKQIEELLGRKQRAGPFPSLTQALTDWKARYTGRDPGHTKNVGWVLGTFVTHFGGEQPCDRLEGRESDIELWLRGLDVTAGVRQQYRRYVLRFLKDSGLAIEKDKISNPKKHEVRRDRGAIDWLEENDAAKVAGFMKEYWADFWRVQLLTGLRPTEQITLKAGDFRGDMLTLSALDHLTLKQGPRTIKIPKQAMDIIHRRLHSGGIVFPNLQHAGWTKKKSPQGPWLSDDAFYKRYREALKKVSGMPFTLDARTARRTFASIQLRKGVDVEYLAKYMGTSPEILREHYASIMPHEVRLKSIRV